MNESQFVVDEDRFAGMRIDRYLAEELALFSRSQLKTREVTLEVNGKPAKWSHRIMQGDEIRITWPEAAPTSIRPEPIDLDILFENEDVLVINKPQGMVVHPAAGNYTGTLAQGLAYRGLSDELSADNPRPGIVHRLDKDTSGVIITAKNPEAREFLANQFAKKHSAKSYLAVVKGLVLPREGTIETYIRRDPKNRKRFTTSEGEGKHAVTEYRVLRQWDNYAFLALNPLTGRTHQLRVHLSAKGHPILGDPIYSRQDAAFPSATLMLHARRLTIMLPRRVADARAHSGFHYEGGEQREFNAPLPQRFKSLILQLAKKSL